MTSQQVMAEAGAVRVRELRAEVARLKAENAALRDAGAALAAHFDLALAAALDLAALPADGLLVIVDGWNRVLAADRSVTSRGKLLELARRHLADRPGDRIWIVFDGPRESVRNEDRLRVSYTGGAGPHRADRLICDFLRAARYRGDVSRIAVVTSDRDFARTAERLGARVPVAHSAAHSLFTACA